jgi:hypothetical protein
LTAFINSYFPLRRKPAAHHSAGKVPTSLRERPREKSKKCTTSQAQNRIAGKESIMIRHLTGRSESCASSCSTLASDSSGSSDEHSQRRPIASEERTAVFDLSNWPQLYAADTELAARWNNGEGLPNSQPAWIVRDGLLFLEDGLNSRICIPRRK